MSKSDELREFIIKYLDWFCPDSGSGSLPKLPVFDLCSQDYLEYAEQEMLAFQNGQKRYPTNAHLINCLAHLKRAIDCQLDTFLHVFNLYNIFSERNLKFEKKLDFLGAIGIFSPRSLTRLNSIRNKMEHEFEIPKIVDIEVYYDLTSAFVAILQKILLLTLDSEIDLDIIHTVDNQDEQIGIFSIKYNFDQPNVSVHWRINGIVKNLVCDLNELPDFAFFFKTYLLLYQKESFATNKYIISQLSK